MAQTHHRRKTKIVAAFVVALGLIVATPLNALADGGAPPPVDSGGNVPGTPPVTPPGGGGVSNPSPAPPGTVWRSGTSKTTPGKINQASTPAGFKNCPARAVNGDADWRATGVAWRGAFYTSSGGLMNGTARLTCIYPPKPTDTPVRCSLGINGIVTQERGPAARRTITPTVSQASAWASDKENPAKCPESLVLNVSGLMDQLGGYLASVTGQQQACHLRSFHDGRPAKIVRCGQVFTNTRSSQGGIWCAVNKQGYDFGYGPASWNHDFSWQPCASRTNNVVGCDLTGLTTLDGYAYPGVNALGKPTGYNEVLGDGRDRTLVFPTLRTGPAVQQITDLDSMLEVDRKNSTPFRELSVNINGTTFPVVTSEPMNSWQDGEMKTSVINWLEANDGDKPWLMRKAVRFDAQVTLTTYRVTSINFNTNQWTVVPVQVTVNATDVRCNSDWTATGVTRARTSN